MTASGGPASARIPVLTALNEAMLRLCGWLGMALVAAISLIVIAAVIWRYVLNDSLSWAEDAAKFLMVWLTFIGAPLGFKHGAHVAIELLPPGLPAAVRRMIRLLVHASVFGLMVMLTYYSWLFTWNGRSQVALTIGDVSMFWIFLALPIGAAVMAMVTLELLIRTALGIAEPTIGEDEALSTQGM